MTEYCDFCYEKERFPTLKQENEQLKQQLENEKQLNAEIKKHLVENQTLLKQKYEENKQLAKRICELQSDLASAKSQIEKMKCCGNCKHGYKYKGEWHEVCKSWELLEDESKFEVKE